jgi:spore germination protein KC
MRHIRLYLALLSACTLLCLTGCNSSGTIYTNYREVEQLQLIQTLGIDKQEEELTLSISSGAGLDGTSPTLMSAGSTSIVGAMNRLQDYASSEELFYAHAKYVLIGEEAAKSGLAGYLDFIERDAQMQLSIALFIVREQTARELIASSGAGETDITDVLSSLERDIRLRGESLPFSCREIARSLAENGSALICAVGCVPTEDFVFSESGEMTALPAGYAVIKDGGLCGYIDSNISQGVNILLGKAGIGNVSLPTEAGGLVTLEFDEVNAKYTPGWGADGTPEKLRMDVTLTTAILELDKVAAEAEGTEVGTLDDELNDLIRALVTEVLETSRDLQADFLGLGTVFKRDNPLRFAQIEDWPAVLGELEFEVQVDGKIQRTFDIGTPLDVEGGGTSNDTGK